MGQIKTKTVSIEPSWVGLLPYMIAMLEDSNAEGKELIKKEFHKMAVAADIGVEYVKSQESQTKLEVD